MLNHDFVDDLLMSREENREVSGRPSCALTSHMTAMQTIIITTKKVPFEWIMRSVVRCVVRCVVESHDSSCEAPFVKPKCNISLFPLRKWCFDELWREFMMLLCLTIVYLSLQKTRDGALQNSFKQLFRLRNNDVLHVCRNWSQRRAGAQLRWLLTSQLSWRLLKKVMIEHTSRETLTFCMYVGDDISTPVERLFHYSTAKCQYFVITDSFHWVVLGIATCRPEAMRFPAGPKQWDFLQGPGNGISCRRRNSQHVCIKCNKYNDIVTFCNRVVKSEVHRRRNIVSDLSAKC